MDQITFLVRFFDVPGAFYVTVIIMAVLAILVRALSRDETVRRRAVVVLGLLMLVIVLRVLTSVVLMEVPGFVTSPTGERIPGNVVNPAYRFLTVTTLFVALITFLLAMALYVVDFLLVERLDFEVPNILRDVTISLLFFVGALMILRFAADLNLAGLLGTSAILSIVVGLALQDTLGNLFSGLALQTERSFNVGDWVRFGDREGVIVDLSWRATKLRTRQNELIIIPNSMISKDVITNYSAPSRVHAVLSPIGAHYRHPPDEVARAIQEAAGQTDGILKRPAVDVRTLEYGDFAVTYSVKYWIRDYADVEDIENAFRTRVWYAFKRHGIEIPFPIRNVYTHQVTEASQRTDREREIERAFESLRKVEIFDCLTEAEARDLAGRARVVPYFTGERVLEQGEVGDALYIIDEGRVEVTISHADRSERLAELESGAILGEMALMTGAARRATVVALEPSRFFVIDRDALRDTIENNLEIAERISETLASRQRELEATHAALHEVPAIPQEAEERSQILARIWDLFGFRSAKPGS